MHKAQAKEKTDFFCKYKQPLNHLQLKSVFLLFVFFSLPF